MIKRRKKTILNLQLMLFGLPVYLEFLLYKNVLWVHSNKRKGWKAFFVAFQNKILNVRVHKKKILSFCEVRE